jgi:glycerol uptake facilitator-like aquaporin
MIQEARELYRLHQLVGLVVEVGNQWNVHIGLASIVGVNCCHVNPNVSLDFTHRILLDPEAAQIKILTFN